MKLITTKISILVTIALLLSSCGFHLAGSGEFSNELDNAYIQPYSASEDLIRSIEKNLRFNNINLSNSEDASVIIHLLKEEVDKEVLTLDSDGKAREYELFLNIAFDVRKADNSVLLKEQNISLSRDFVFNKRDLLGANEEEQQLYMEMRKDAARLIMYRLQKI